MKLDEQTISDINLVIDYLQIRSSAKLSTRNRKIIFFSVDNTKPHILLIQGVKLKLMPALYERYSQSFDFQLDTKNRELKVRKVNFDKKKKTETYEPTITYTF